MKPLALIIFTTWMHLYPLFAISQDRPDSRFYDSIKIAYADRGSFPKAIKGFLPSISPAMIRFGQKEVNLFNSLITANRFRGSDRVLYNANNRSTYNYSILQFTLGVSPTNRFNVGLTINSVLGLIDENRKGFPMAVFSGDSNGNSHSAKAITTVGVHTRWQPIKTTSQLILQSSLLVPTLHNVDKETVIGKSQAMLINTILYGVPFARRLYFLPQVTLQYGFRRSDAPALFILPVSTYISYLLSTRVFLFTVASSTPVFVHNESWKLNSYTVQLGGGAQYQPSRRLLLNTFLTHDVYGKAYFHALGFHLGTRMLFN